MSQGASIADFGLATTPAMFMSCILPGTVDMHMLSIHWFAGAAVASSYDSLFSMRTKDNHCCKLYQRAHACNDHEGRKLAVEEFKCKDQEL